VASSGFALYGIAHGVNASRRVLRVNPKTLVGAGLLTSCLSGLISLTGGDPFLTGLWSDKKLPFLGKVGTPLLFDVGVYLVVLGVVTLVIFSLAEE